MAIRIPNPGRGEDSAALRPDATKCREMADALIGALTWKDTAEGHDFWQAVRDRMFELANIATGDDPPPPPRLPDPPARPSSQADQLTLREYIDAACGIEVDHHPSVPEWSLYTMGADGLRHWFADYEVGTNDDQYTAEEAEALAFDYAERLLEAFPCLRARGINPKE